MGSSLVQASLYSILVRKVIILKIKLSTETLKDRNTVKFHPDVCSVK